MMQKALCTGLLMFFSMSDMFAQSNVGVGTMTPDPSALLDLTSSDKGILIPRLNSIQRINVVSPAEGLMVYDIDTDSFWYFDGVQWVEAIGPAGPAGPTGVAGANGATGPQGIQGPTGAAGANGLPGVTGPTGAAGADGADGVDGVTGPTGPVGPMGPSGANASIPSGVIMMWSGTVNTIPSGYALCDGGNGTPNLFDKFILSIPDPVTNPGISGGNHSYSLSVAQLPAHTHTGSATTSTNGDHGHGGNTTQDGSHDHGRSGTNSVGNGGFGLLERSGGGNNTVGTVDQSVGEPNVIGAPRELGLAFDGGHTHSLNVSNAGNHSHTVSFISDATGSGASIDNRPVYFTLAFIMKL